MEEITLHTSSGAYRRRIQIEDCLFDNLQHTPYHSVRVADLCRQVGISRKAFYNYYRDKDDCLCAYIYRIIRESMLYVTTSVSDDATILETNTLLLEHWKSLKPFWDVVVRNQLLHFVNMEVIRFVQNEDRVLLDMLNNTNVEPDGDILCCYISLLFTLVLQWYFRGFQPSAEEMAKKLTRLAYEPILLSSKDGK